MANPPLETADRRPLLLWLIFTGVSAFAAVLLWHFGLFRRMVEADRSYISSAIGLLYLATTVHCLWRIVVVSREDDAARRVAALGETGATPGSHLPRGLIGDFVRDLAAKAAVAPTRHPDPTAQLRGLATRLRGPNRFGDFASDTLMKLGLVGTIIGFIMMLAPIATLDVADRGAIKVSMNLMSDGMAVAMYTTLAGLVASILVKVQYYVLEDATARLFLLAVALGDTWRSPPKGEVATDVGP
jgi:MotA/TolQ/ExbB proton channel family